MKRLIQYFALVGLSLLLAGCFRSAGDIIEPTQEATAIADAVSTTTPPDTEGQLTTPTLPPITILPPNTRVASTDESTAEVGGETATRSPQTIVAPPTETPQFITPGSPLGPVAFDTSAPQPTSNGTASGAALTAGTANPARTQAVDEECIYVVESGDSLYAIALLNDTTVDDILAVNPTLEGDPPILFPGDELNLPDCGENIVTDEPESEPTARATRPGTPEAGEIYVIQAGDTLFNIAQRNGITIADIVAANPDINPDVLAIGQEIIIPPSDE